MCECVCVRVPKHQACYCEWLCLGVSNRCASLRPGSPRQQPRTTDWSPPLPSHTPAAQASANVCITHRCAHIDNQQKHMDARHWGLLPSLVLWCLPALPSVHRCLRGWRSCHRCKHGWPFFCRCMHGWAWSRPGECCCTGRLAAAKLPWPMPLPTSAGCPSCVYQRPRLCRECLVRVGGPPACCSHASAHTVMACLLAHGVCGVLTQSWPACS